MSFLFGFYFLLLSLASISLSLPIYHDTVLQEAPKEAPSVSPYVLSLYESFAAESEQQEEYQYNILRSFERSTQFRGCKDSKYTFTFNMSSIPKEEDISKAIFRVYVNISTSFSSSQGSAQITLTSNDSKLYTKVITPNESQFVDFPVQQHIQDWLKNGQLKYLVNLGVTIDLANGPLECYNKDMNIVYDNTHDNTQPSLVVYSYDGNENLDELNKAISIIQSTEKNANQRNTRSSGTSNGECRKSELTITKEQLGQVLGEQILFPDFFPLNVCGGWCPSNKYMKQLNSIILYHLLATPSENGENHIANKSKYSKCCVPTKYTNVTRAVIGINGSIYKKAPITAQECSCVYTYSQES
ncbi:PREDICTED: bone morphogenetic protein 4-like [Amphimedon queenslandica]|uniref:TGF-beta family profile domain-containing protein n=1 Tax=Amphimedon queenslandica TaxID=400682 RepID=A0A1X7VXL7_AMPQE|nr:PREDICTED: bone morphogenetic protein 4-like [Amphimedon queenslandica]|eukprot:XP_011410537.1 PREDICTED: bone morphogenetic protein 4-like [Amphimedon queenslandica]